MKSSKYDVPCPLLMRYCCLAAKMSSLLDLGVTMADQVHNGDLAKARMHDEILKTAGVERGDILFECWLAEHVREFVEAENDVLQQLRKGGIK